MWIILLFILLIVFFILNAILSEKKNTHQKFVDTGGLWTHYSTLISSIVAENPSLQNKGSTADMITLIAYYEAGYEKYFIRTSFSKLQVFWEMDSIKYGKHNLKWTFNPTDDQKTIAAIISTAALNYKMKLTSV